MPYTPRPLPRSIYSQMTQKALEVQAVNLAQGFPDEDGPKEIIEEAIRALQSQKNQYAPSHGIPSLRQAISEHILHTYGLSYDPETEVTIVSGATEGMYCALQSLFQKGDEIIAFEPHYESYPAAARQAGLLIKGCPLLPPDFSIDFDRLHKLITKNTKGIILNMPHNPTGRVLKKDERVQLAALANKYDLTVVTDEVYETLTYERAHVPMASLPGMRERTVTISSTSKSYSLTGWKIGFVLACPSFTAPLRGFHQHTVFCSATPLQWGMVKAFELDASYYLRFREDFVKKRDLLVTGLRKLHFKVKEPEGTYFVLADYSYWGEGMEDQEFARILCEKAKVATIPISSFYLDPRDAHSLRYIRFAFCKRVEVLEEALRRLETGLHALAVS